MSGTRRIIGVDESGKGDFFGPLVVAAFLADNSDREKLAALGVRDGKKIANKRLLAIDEELRETYPHEVLVIAPSDYNARYRQIKNLNKLLASCHAEVISALADREKADLAVSDQFGKPELIEREMARRGQEIAVDQITGGERQIQVAAASILARARFIREIDAITEEYAVDIPRGAAAQVDEAGRRLVRIHGVEVLEKVAKVHFKNFIRATNPSLFS